MLKEHFHHVYEQETTDMPIDAALQSRIAHNLGMQKTARTLKPWYFSLGLAGATAAIALTMNLSSSPLNLKVDDWVYNIETTSDYLTVAKPASFTSHLLAADAFDSASVAYESSTIGLSAGGAEDANAFRDDIANGYVPLPTDLTYEGLFSEYYFETSEQDHCNALFCPTYATGVSPDPFTGKNDYYLSVGLNSGMKESDFARKPLNIVVALDISGSMASSLEEYHYDQTGWGIWDDIAENFELKSKMEVAKEAVIDLLGHLEDEDRVGVVLFDSEAVIAKPLRDVGETDMASIKGHVREIQPQGGTNMSDGIDLATSLFKDVSKEGYENRIIFITDAMPNRGDLTEEGMRGTMETNAKNGIYTTFIGVGVDFQTELVEAITKTEGANYYAVHSSEDFRERMDEGFDYMVTPLVFDLNLSLDAEGFEIAQVYGSPEANEATGEIIYVNTLFPSMKKGGETKGGVILLKLKKTGDNDDLRLRVSYKDRNGKVYEESTNASFSGVTEEDYENPSVEKAIWLARYADLMKHWMVDARENVPVPSVAYNVEGLIAFPDTTRSPWEQSSMALTVSTQYKQVFANFREAFAFAVHRHGDMQQELDIIDKLINL